MVINRNLKNRRTGVTKLTKTDNEIKTSKMSVYKSAQYNGVLYFFLYKDALKWNLFYGKIASDVLIL